MRKTFRRAVAVAAAMALVVVAAGAWFGYQRMGKPTCSGQVRLSVAAAPEIAPAVQASAERWMKDGAAVDGVCVAVEVAQSDPIDMAATVASKHDAFPAGVGQASGTTVMPDVWLPDSSIWLLRLHAVAFGFAPGNNASVARSPVVVAIPEPIAAFAGWPDKKVSWADLLKQTTGGKLHAGTVEPTRDAASLAGLLAFTTAIAGSGDGAQEAIAATFRALATGKSALRQDLLARFPRSTDPASLAAGLAAAALSEKDVIAFNAKKPPIPLAALYLDPAPMALDYPYAVMPGTEPAKAAAAEGLFKVLGTSSFRDRLGAQGLRAPDGNWGAGFNAPRGAPSPAASAPASASPSGGKAAGGLDPASVDRVLSTWTAVTLPARMLAVVDVSGSMLTKVPTAGGATRAQVTLAAAQRSLTLFNDSWSVGLWTFSTELVGKRDYKELVPIGLLSSQRSRLVGELNSITPKRGGNTGLYDTMLAAYKAVQDGWEPGRVNSVVMLTDGKNDDANGITREKLLAGLKELADPEKPVQMVVIGIGNEVSKEDFKDIGKVTGGGVFVAEDPAKIGDIFLKAIALRPATIN